MDETPSLRAPRDRRRWFVVSYDIPDNKRRTKVMKLLEGYGRRAQYSVFECHVAPEEMQQLEKRLLSVIDKRQDDVRIYVCCDACARKARMLGKAERYQAPSFLIL